MDLKTITDFYALNPYIKELGERNKLLDSLREEATKWILTLNREKDIETINFIKFFFNISEEELNDARQGKLNDDDSETLRRVLEEWSGKKVVWKEMKLAEDKVVEK